jgi:PTS system nitrogen regulatory IIA component
MSNVTQLLGLAAVRCHAEAHSRKRALQLAADLIANDTDLSADNLFDGLMERERLGSTGLGAGVAIPHCRMACNAMRVAFLTLNHPVDHEAPDGDDVDIIFVIVVPNDENQAHLDALAVLSEIFVDPDNRTKLRGCTTAKGLLSCIRGMADPGPQQQQTL